MPLSLRRSKNTTQTSNPKRIVSNPTLLSRFRSSAFSSSKTSLLATSPYEMVKARTPPIPVCRPAGAPRPSIRRPKPYGALHDHWRARSRRLNTPEQRDCLFGAECIEIRDPLLGRIDSPDVSVNLESDMSNLSISIIQEESTDVGMDGVESTRSPSPIQRPYHTLPHTPTPRPRLHNLLRNPGLRKKGPIASNVVTQRPRFSPYRMTTVTVGDRTPERMTVVLEHGDSSAFSSPVIVSLHSPNAPSRPRYLIDYPVGASRR